MVMIKSVEVKDGETNLVNVENLLMGLVDRVPVVDQDRHGASRVDISQVLDTLKRIQVGRLLNGACQLIKITPKLVWQFPCCSQIQKVNRFDSDF